jgi:hypothetical protein
LASADFSGAVFTRAYFQKISQISSLCDFYYISEGIPSLMHFRLLMTYEQAKVYCIAESETNKKYHKEAKHKQENHKAGGLGQSHEFHLKRKKRDL